MTKDLYQQILDKQKRIEAVPPNEEIASWGLRLIGLLFPELSRYTFDSIQKIEEESRLLKNELLLILNATKACCKSNIGAVARDFFESIPELYRLLNTDVQALLNVDPAAKTEFEVIRTYPGFYALCFYRIAHLLATLEVPLIPRILTEFAHSKTGIDIHPSAEIGEYFHIDHGTGIVIGETATIGNHVKVYQGVTLGALIVNKSMAFTKRHPTVEDHVIIYSGATILGGETVIGHHSIIGGNVWLTNSVPPGSLVFHDPEITVKEGKALNI